MGTMVTIVKGLTLKLILQSEIKWRQFAFLSALKVYPCDTVTLFFTHTQRYRHFFSFAPNLYLFAHA